MIDNNTYDDTYHVRWGTISYQRCELRVGGPLKNHSLMSLRTLHLDLKLHLEVDTTFTFGTYTYGAYLGLPGRQG